MMALAGMNKIVINHLDKTFVTSDASLMMTELEVQHPAAKLVVMAAKAQEAEVGDASNMVRVPERSELPACTPSATVVRTARLLHIRLACSIAACIASIG